MRNREIEKPIESRWNNILIDLNIIKDKHVIIYCPAEINEKTSCDKILKEFHDLLVLEINRNLKEFSVS